MNSTWSSKDDKSARKSILRGGTSNLRPSSPKEAEPKKKLLTLAASDTGTSPSPKSDEKFFGLFGKTSNDNMSTTEVEVTPDGAMGSSPTQMKNENANEEEQKEFLSILDDLQNVFARSSSITPSEVIKFSYYSPPYLIYGKKNIQSKFAFFKVNCQLHIACD